jgi:drug/metabolite transporter (DMT)-like permease
MSRLVALVALTMVAFAANSVLNRMALAGTATGPAAFAAIRLAAGAAVLGVLTLHRGGMARLRAGLAPRNALALGVYMLGFSFAYVTLDAGIGALLLFGGVQITMFAGSVLAGDRIPPARGLGAGIAFLGLLTLLWPAGAAAPPLSGAVLMLAAAVGWGCYSLLGRGSRDPLGVTAGAFLLALAPAAVVLAVAPGRVDGPGVALALVSGAVTSGLGYALWYSLLPRLASSVAAVVQLTVPVIAALAGALLLGEAPGLRFAVAAALVLGGVAVAIRAPSVPARRG